MSVVCYEPRSGMWIRLIKRQYFFIAFFLSFSACRHSSTWKPSDILIRPDEKFQSKLKLTQYEVEEDISFLIYAMENGYGGRKHIPNGKFELAIKKIQKIQNSLSSEELKNQIDRALLEIPDNHLMAKLNGSPAPERTLSNQAGQIGNNKTPRSKIWDVKTINEKEKKVLYVGITKFPSYKDKVWNGFIESVKAKMHSTDLAVLDLRGNGGGDDTKGLEFANLMYGGKAPYPVTRQYVSQSPETLAIFANNFQIRSLKLKKEGKLVPSYYAELKNEKLKEFQHALNGKRPVEQVRELKSGNDKFDSKRGYGKAIFILMDGACGSSCESTIDAFEFHPYAKKVGQNTAGYIHFGNIGYILLPNSKIEVQIPTQYNEYFDGRFLERVGLSPDVKVPDGKDAYTFLIETLI